MMTKRVIILSYFLSTTWNFLVKLRIYGVLLCMYDVRNKLDRDIKEILPAIGEESGFHVFSSPVRISQDIKNVQAFPDEINENGDVEVTNRSLIENFPNSNGALDYIKLVDEMKGVINNG